MPRNRLNGKVVSAEGTLFTYKIVGEKSIDTYRDLYQKIFKESFDTVKCTCTTDIYFIRKEDENRIIGLVQLTDEIDHVSLDYLGFTPGYNKRELETLFVKALSERYPNFVVFPQNNAGIQICKKLEMPQVESDSQPVFGTTMKKGPVTVSRASA